MASSTKIDEIIDPKAFADWERFVKSLETGQQNMSKMVSEVMDLNKAIQATGDAIAQGGEFIQDLSGFVDYPKINGMGLEDIGMVIEGYGKAITVGNKYLGPWLGENLP